MSGSQADASGRSEKLLCFSDVDGTLVHYEDMTRFGAFVGREETGNLTLWRDNDTSEVQPVVRLPPSHSGAQGTISVRTLDLLAELRTRGALLALVTGGRLATLLQRLPFLPAADAYVCENGGRIFYPGSADLRTACPLTEDMQWRLQHSATAGPPSAEWQPPSARKGSLWDAFRALKAAGWNPDANSYTTCFRLRLAPDKSEEDLAAAATGLPGGLSTSYNLGCLDVYPATSGKSRAGVYLLTHFRAPPERSCLLCDDDNDLALAAAVSRVFLPSITSESVRAAAAREPDKFVTASKGAVRATEEMLARVLEIADAE